MSLLALLPPVKASFEQDGEPLAGGKVYFYEPGTTTPKATYSDASGTVANTNPVILDAQGRAVIFLSGIYKVRVTNSLDAEVYTLDNVSASPYQTLVVDEWKTSGVTPAYISATSFSVSGDYTGTFEPGRRIKAVDSGGTDYGTITSSSYDASTTTVNVILDSGSLDSGLASVDVGILTLTNKSIPVQPTLTKTDDYVLVKADHGKTIIFNKGTAVVATLPSPSAVWSGWKVTIKNIGSGALTLTGTVEGIVDGTISTNDEVTIWSNGTAFYGKRVSAIPARENSIPVTDNTGKLDIAWLPAATIIDSARSGAYLYSVPFSSLEWLTEAKVGTGSSAVLGVGLRQLTSAAANDLTRNYGTGAFFLPFITGKPISIEWSIFDIPSTASSERRCIISYVNTAPAGIDKHFGFRITNADIFAVSGDGSTAVSTDTTINAASGKQLLRLRADFTPGTDIKFYVDGVLRATHDTNLPTVSDLNTFNIFVLQTKTTTTSIAETKWGGAHIIYEY